MACLVALLIAPLVCICNGRRNQLMTRIHEDQLHPTNVSTDARRLTYQPKVLARLLFALNSDAAFNPPGKQIRTFLPNLPANRAWPSSLTTHVAQGIGLAISEAAQEGGFAGGVRSAARLVDLVFDSLVFFPLTQIPFAVRTLQYRASTMQLEKARLPLEVYKEGGTLGGPLVLFVHGGSWGQGAPWQYALLAQRLLKQGASKVAVAQYSLFPDGDVNDMLDELDAALRWCQVQQEQHATSGSGSPLRVVLAAQSAGAHLCALHFSQRSFHENRGDVAWLPDRFVALSGVFDIGPHFAHERTRLVHWLSPMWRAMIGKSSPSGQEFAAVMASAISRTHSADEPGALVEAIAMLSTEELDTAGISCASVASESRGPADAAVASAAEWSDREMAAWAAASPTRILRLRRLASSHTGKSAPSDIQTLWPPTTVLHAADDKTVPVTSARAFVDALKSCGCAPKEFNYSEYERAGHGEIMIRLVGQNAFDELPAVAQEFLRRVCE